MNGLKCNCSMAASSVRGYFIETSLCDCILHVSAVELLGARGREVFCLNSADRRRNPRN